MKEASFSTVFPSKNPESIRLGNPPPNKFMPCLENLKSLKLERDDEDSDPGLPQKIESPNGDYLLWFKQDDTFD